MSTSPDSPVTPLMEALQTDARDRVALAHALGIDTSTLWRWTNGHNEPRSQAMRRNTALVLGRSESDLWPAVAA